MSLLGNVARSLKEDVVNVATAPVRGYRHGKYVVRGLRNGTVRKRDVARSAAATLGATAMMAVLLFPVYYVTTAAFTGSQTLQSTNGVRLIPSDPTIEPFVWVIQESSFFDYMYNSMYVATFTVLLSMSVIVPAAYALSRREFLLRKKILYGYVLLTQIGGGLGIATLIALYAMLSNAGLTDNKFILACYYAATAVPFNTWLLKTYMDGIPVSYEEAAVVDGAPPWRVVLEVILPLSKAGLATVFIFAFLAGWTEFVIAQQLLRAGNYTLPVGLYALVGRYSIPWSQFAAYALMFASPIAFIYLFAQRYIEGGLSFGGMEG
ncbi:ABC transporter permease subunit [Halostella sp. JP-L12]|uniref:sugar ABC transporter permease n=1 Tax=Halostella TaxID=1843185 RepID=UPI000EF7B436|nr:MULTISPECIES: ABC transporter permease subunit [Halostella]NHN48130.1 ABC transporter permease subunit [Halostella sp. JP-L12]